MAKSDDAKKKPLWLAIEEAIFKLDGPDLSGATLESTVHGLAAKLDEAGYNVSKHSGNLLQLRWALDDMRKVGRPLMKDFNECIEALILEQAVEPYKAADDIIRDVGGTWPKFKASERRPVVIAFVEQRRLDLLIEKARALSGDKGIELLIDEAVASETIIEAMEITEEKLKEVNAEMERRRAERKRVLGLLEKVQDKSDEEKVRHLIDNDVAEPLILELAGVEQSAIEAVNKAMEEELKEKQRLAEEEAARKKKEAEGPALDDISADDMLAHIEAIREIMEFSDVEKEIRTMCEQSGLPKALVDIAVSDPDKLDELEKQAGG
jgi:hypothetical protein